MTLPDISILVGRHEEKDATKKVTTGAADDKAVDLSPNGKRNARNNGRLLIPHRDGVGPMNQPLAYISGVVSDHLRALRTFQEMLIGAGYNVNDEEMVSVVQRGSIGLGPKLANDAHYDWKANSMPEYDPADPSPFVEAMLTQRYRPSADRPELPSMARYTAALLDTIIASICYIQATNSDPSLILNINHGPVIDGLANALYGSLNVTEDGRPELFNFPGAFNTGQVITGKSVSMGADPRLVFEVKGKEVAYTLSQLCEMQKMHAH